MLGRYAIRRPVGALAATSFCLLSPASVPAERMR